MTDVRNAVAGAMMRSPLYAQAWQTHPMIDLSDPKYDDIRHENGAIISPLENAVDAYIQQRQMKTDDRFSVMHPDGVEYHYRYLGPDSGGRKDWIEVKPPAPDVPMS